MGYYAIGVMIALSFLQPVQAESVSSFLIQLCADRTGELPDSAPSKEARRIFATMKETEKRRCALQGENYIHYLIKKYRAQMSG